MLILTLSEQISLSVLFFIIFLVRWTKRWEKHYNRVMVVGIMKHKKYNLIRVGLICSSLLFTNSGCGVKTVDCDIEGEHVHLYVSESNLLSRYI